MPPLVLAVVEIADSPFLLLIAAIFIVTFIGVCALAYRLLAKARRDGDPTVCFVANPLICGPLPRS